MHFYMIVLQIQYKNIITSKKMTSGQLLSNLNKNIDTSHHKKLQTTLQSQPTQPQKAKPLNQQKHPIIVQQKQSNQQQKVSKKKAQVNKVKQVEKVQIQHKDVKKQTQKSQGKSIRSNLSKASQIISKKDNFKNNFQRSSLLAQEQQNVQTLHQILAMQMGKLISQPLAEVIESALKQRQNMIYIAYTQDNTDYLQNLLLNYKRKQDNNISEIEQLLSNRQNKTLQKLNNLQLFIDRQRSINTKNQLQQLSKLDAARLLKIKQGSIKSKIQLLNHKMFQFQSLQASAKSKNNFNLQQYQQQKLQELTDPSNFSLSSQKTKIANDYVKHLHHQKLVLLKKMREREQKRTQLEKQRQIQIKQAQQMRNLAKKQQIQTRIMENQKKRQQQTKQIQDKTKKVQQLLKQYRKSLPLYKKKQRQFANIYIKKKQKQIQEKLKDIRQNRRSLSMNQIRQHQQKYSQRRSIDQSKRQQQFKMMMKAKQASEAGKQYFKGFFHDKVKVLDQQQKLKYYSLREQTKRKIQRMTQFGDKIKKYHQPKIDNKKKQDLQTLIQLQQLKKKKVKKIFKQVPAQNGQVKLQAYYQEIPQVNHYKQGNKFMEVCKSLAKKRVNQQTSRYSQKPQIQLTEHQEVNEQKTKPVTSWDTPSSIISQEKDIWRLRSKQLHQMTEDINSQNFYQIKKNLQEIDNRARMKQDLLKFKQIDAHEILQQKNILDEFYLESIKNKIKLLNE